MKRREEEEEAEGMVCKETRAVRSRRCGSETSRRCVSRSEIMTETMICCGWENEEGHVTAECGCKRRQTKGDDQTKKLCE
jgi:hypothetical protein